MERTIFNDSHEIFRRTAREFMAKEVVPHFAEWDAAGIVPRDVFRRIGELGVLGMQIPEEYGAADPTASCTPRSGPRRRHAPM